MECINRANRRSNWINSVFLTHGYDQNLLDLPVLDLLDRWKRKRTKSQNIKLENLNIYVTQHRVKSHSVRIRKEIEEKDFKNIEKIIMKK